MPPPSSPVFKRLRCTPNFRCAFDSRSSREMSGSNQEAKRGEKSRSNPQLTGLSSMGVSVLFLEHTDGHHSTTPSAGQSVQLGGNGGITKPATKHSWIPLFSRASVCGSTVSPNLRHKSKWSRAPGARVPYKLSARLLRSWSPSPLLRRRRKMPSPRLPVCPVGFVSPRCFGCGANAMDEFRWERRTRCHESWGTVCIGTLCVSSGGRFQLDNGHVRPLAF